MMDHKEKMVIKVIQALLVMKDLQVFQETWDLKATKELLDHRDQLDTQAQKDQ